MAIRIRLRRLGNKNNPFYRIVAADARTSTRGRIKETIGWYDPEKGGVNFKLNLERFDYWAGTGAQVSSTVKNLAKKARSLPALAEAEAQAEPVAVTPEPAATPPEPAPEEPVVAETVEPAQPAPSETGPPASETPDAS
jgi:small subunit ribosomal protein S16